MTTALEPAPPVVAPPQARAAPAAGRRPKLRLHGVDAARGVALIGMMVIHVLPDENPATGGPAWTYVISAGNASALFAVLAGVSIAFTTGRARVGLDRVPATVASLTARGAVVGFIGLALGYTDAELAAVILPYYALMFLLAIPVVFLPTWGVVCAGVTFVAGAPALTFLLTPHLPPLPESTLNPGFDDVFTRPLELLSELMVTGEFPALTWIAYLCAGLVIGRLTLSSSRTASRMLVAGCVATALAHVASGLLLYRYGGLQQIWSATDTATVDYTREVLTFGADGTPPSGTWWWLAVVEPHSGTPLDLVSTIGIATAVLAAILLLDHVTAPLFRMSAGLLTYAVAAAGKMTLTFYTLHVMFINSIHDNYVPTTSLVLQVIAAIVLGIAWQASAGRGPLEALTATVTARAKRFASRHTNKKPRPADSPGEAHR
jgi:uncharacterized membrane protein